MGRPLFYQDPRTGEKFFVDPQSGRKFLLSEVDPGMPAGRRADLYSRLPDAQLAGMYGAGVKKPGEGIDAGPPPSPTHRPLAGLLANNRGNSQLLAPDANGLAIASSIVETPRSNGDDAEIITVTLGLEFDGQPPGSQPDEAINFIANVTWGIGGANFEADIDWQQGTSFSLAASFISVGCTYTSVPFAFGPVPPTARLSASLAYGYNGQEGGLRLTDSGVLASLNPGASTLVNIPRFATGFAVVPPGDNTDLIFTFGAGTGAFINTFGEYRYNSSSNLGNQNNPFPIPNGAFWMEVFNNGPAVLPPTGHSGSLVWHLSL